MPCYRKSVFKPTRSYTLNYPYGQLQSVFYCRRLSTCITICWVVVTLRSVVLKNPRIIDKWRVYRISLCNGLHIEKVGGGCVYIPMVFLSPRPLIPQWAFTFSSILFLFGYTVTNIVSSSSTRLNVWYITRSWLDVHTRPVFGSNILNPA